MEMHKNFITIILVISALALTASCGPDTHVKKGDKFWALGEYFDAAAEYKKAYSSTPAKERAARGQRAMKMAECYRRINYTSQAIAAYTNAIRYKQDDSLTALHLAQQLMKNGRYKEAEKYFVTAQDSLGAHPLVKSGLISARSAAKWKEDGSLYTVKRENLFNSRRADYSPVLSCDNYDQLYFTSTRNQARGDDFSGITGTKNGDIFLSVKNEQGKWQRPQAIDTELNSDADEGACSITPDGRMMYLTQCKTDPSYPRYAQICTSQRSDAVWGKSTVLEITRDTLSSYAHPAVSPDGQWLYFTSDMPGGLGGLDIWRIRITSAGLVGLENLGAPINTAGDEEFPTFRPNGDLYFSSNGHPGLGGLDIFIAKPDDSGKGWKIEHPGFPLNSQGDDFGMTFEGLHNRGFFSSNRGDGKGWDHIYSFEKEEIAQTVKGWVYERDGYELPAAQVYMVGSDGTNVRHSVKGDGSFTAEVTPGVDYLFLATCKGFLNCKEELRVVRTAESVEHVLQFPLASIAAPVLIDNIFYDFDKATLRPESTVALDSLILLLNDNPNVTIELSAHTDYRGSDKYNKALSQRRAESVVNYLIEHGIDKERLSPVGYGKERAKKIKKRLTERYPFLKENDELTEDFIKTLTAEQQELCNQLNRRTEFKVLRTTYGLFDGNGNLKPVNEQKQ